MISNRKKKDMSTIKAKTIRFEFNCFNVHILRIFYLAGSGKVVENTICA